MNDIKVSICCISFNQKKYIAEAIDSFLMQKTNFEFEILINDDCSTDGTTEILEDYQRRYPDKIVLVKQKENQFSKGKRNMMLRYLFPITKGKYLALCEGDDYWTDENKLQKQVDFLDNNEDYSVCFHPVNVKYENGDEDDFVYPEPSFVTKNQFNLDELLDINFIPTCSAMYRKTSYENVDLEIIPGDHFMALIHSKEGKIKYIDELMGVYRKHPNGIWIDKEANKRNLENNVIGILKFYQYYSKVNPLKDEELIKIFDNKIRIYFDFLLEQKLYNKLEECIKIFPNYAILYLKILYFEVNGHFGHIKYLETQLADFHQKDTKDSGKLSNLLKKVKKWCRFLRVLK